MSALIEQWRSCEVTSEQKNDFKHKCISDYGRRDSDCSLQSYSTSEMIFIPSSHVFYIMFLVFTQFLLDGIGTTTTNVFLLSRSIMPCVMYSMGLSIRCF